MKKGIKLGTASILAISALTPVAAFAAESTVQNGVYSSDGFYTPAEFQALSVAEKKAIVADAKSALVSGDVVYNLLGDVISKSDAEINAITTTVAEYEAQHNVSFNSGNGFDEPTQEDLKVESVSAITTTIKQAADQQLEFTINEDKAATVADLKEAGYDVAFAYTVASSEVNKTTGVIDASKAPFNAAFEYQVTVSKDGEKVAESEWTKVEALAATTAVKVLELGIEDAAGEGFPTSYITKDTTGAKVVATKAENAFGDTEGVALPGVKNIVSSDVTVVTYEADGTLNPRKEGKVTLTVEFHGIEEKVTYELEVKAAQAPKVVESGQTTKVQTTVANSIEISLVDQYGEALRSSQALTYTLEDAAGDVVNTSTETVAAGEKGTVSVNLPEAGNYTVEISKGEKVIGTLNLEGVAVDATKIDTFTLTSPKSELDLKAGSPATLTVTANGFVNGVKVSQADVDAAIAVKGLTFKSSDEEVATVDENGVVTPEAVGTTKISLVKVEGQKVTTFATFDVTVKNSTEQITSLTLKDNAEEIVVNDAATLFAEPTSAEAKAYVASKLTAGKDKDGKEIFKSTYIDSIEYVAANKQIIVSINDINGGQDFVFNIKEDEETVLFAEYVSNEFVAFTPATPAEVAEAGDVRPAINEGDVLVPAEVAEAGDVVAESAAKWNTGDFTVLNDNEAGTFVFNDVTVNITAGDALTSENDNIQAGSIDLKIKTDEATTAADQATLVVAALNAYKESANNELNDFTFAVDGDGILITDDVANTDHNEALEVTTSDDVVIANTDNAAQLEKYVAEIKLGDILVPAVTAGPDDVQTEIKEGDILVPANDAENGSLTITFSSAIALGDLNVAGVALVEGTYTIAEDNKSITVEITTESADELKALSVGETVTVTGVVDKATGEAVTVESIELAAPSEDAPAE